MHNQNLITALSNCAALCEYCADACLGEEKIKMLVECIRIDKDCADICRTAINYASRDSKRAGDIIEICASICAECAEECEKHADKHDHCRDCAKACRDCEEKCKSYTAA
jgi:hypothetical protein